MTASPAASTATAVPAALAVSPRELARLVVKFLGSMRLAVWLLLVLALLTWLGTLAQTGRSTYDVQREYFESWFVVAQLPLSLWGQALFPMADGEAWAMRIPLPGAYPVMGLLFANLLVGGFLRMKWNARYAGILIIHFGIAFLLIAGFVKMQYSYAGALSLYESPANGNTLSGRVYESSLFRSFHDFELALLVDRGGTIEERVVPEARLWGARGDGVVTLAAPGLPFTLQVHHWIDFADVKPKGPMVKTLMPVVDGAYLEQQRWPLGKQPEADQEYAGCYVTVMAQGGQRFEGLLWGFPRMPLEQARYPFSFTVDGTRYGLDLRHVMYDLPYSVRLDKFQKLDHPGTSSPRDFRSFVTVHDGTAKTEAQVFMNNPLRKGGYVVYQTSWGPPVGGPPFYSVFEVSYNPSDIWPALACGVIALGLLVHFASKLARFLQSSTRISLASETKP